MKRSYQETDIEEESKVDITPESKKQKETEFEKVTVKDLSKWTVEDCEIDVMILFMSQPRFIERVRKTIIEAVLMDRNGDKIKASAWDDEAQRLQRFKALECVKIKSFRLIETQQKYKHFHDYSISIGYKSNLIPLEGGKVETLNEAFQNQWNFQSIQQTKQQPDATLVDVAGVLIRDEIPSPKKRILTIMDETSVMQVTLWVSQTKVVLNLQDVVVISAGKVSSFNNGSLSSAGLIMRNPSCPKVQQLQSWLEKVIQSTNYESVVDEMQLKQDTENLKTFDVIQDMLLQFGSNPIITFRYFTVKGFIKDIEHYNLFYGDNPCHYKARVTISDHLGRQLQIIAFDEAGKKIFGCSANDLKLLQQTRRRQWVSKMTSICKNKTELFFMMQAKLNEYGGSSKIQLLCQDVKVAPIHPTDKDDVKNEDADSKERASDSGFVSKMKALSCEPNKEDTNNDEVMRMEISDQVEIVEKPKPKSTTLSIEVNDESDAAVKDK